MALASLRRSSRLIAAVVLLASIWQLPHRAEDDEICVPAATEAHDESKHIVVPAGAASHQDHCAICHWLRSIKPAFSAGPAAMLPVDSGRRLSDSTSDVPSDAGADRLPARAPPSPLV